MKPSVSVFIPMYNEETNAGILIPMLLKHLSSFTDDFEIIIVDDASKDRTVPLVQDYVSREPRIRLVQHKTNQGYGTALRTGFLSATKDIVFYTDADVPIDFAVLNDVLPQMKNHPVIIGYRIDRHDTWKRWLFSFVYNRIIRYFFGVRVRDINFSFKVFRKEVVDQFKDKLEAKSVFIDGELLIWIHRLGFKMHEWPIDYRPREFGLSTLGTWRQAKLTLMEIWNFWRKKK